MNALNLQSSRAFGSTASDCLTIFIDLDQSVFGPTPDYVGKAVRHVCGLRFPGETLDRIRPDQFHNLAREYYSALSQGENGERDALTFVAYVSTYFHEVRHVHDLLATNYGQEVLFKILNCAQNVSALLHGLGEWLSTKEGRTVYVPLATGIAQMDGLPEEFVNLVVRYGKALTDIEEFGRSRPSSPSAVSIVHLLEGSAVDAQLTLINDVFGPIALFELIRFINEGGGGSTYLQIRDELIDLLTFRKGTRTPPTSCLNYLIWTALMSTTFPDREFSEGPGSVTFYEALAQYLVQQEGDLDFEQTRKAVDKLCDAWGLLRPTEVVQRRGAYLRAQSLRAEQQARRLGSDDNFNFGVMLKSFAQAYGVLNNSILSSGDTYFDPIKYVANVLLGRLPAVPLRLKVDGKIHDFLTRGYEIMPFERWAHVSLMVTIFRVLVKGRATSDANPWDDMCWNLMLEGSWGKSKLRVRECSPLFS